MKGLVASQTLEQNEKGHRKMQARKMMNETHATPGPRSLQLFRERRASPFQLGGDAIEIVDKQA